MAKYKITKTGNFIDTEAGLFIPDDLNNKDRILMQKWIDAGNIVDPAESLDEAKNRRKSEIKILAGTLILSIYPQWKQVNMLARALELVNLKIDSGLNSEQQSELEDLQNIWNSIKEVSLASDEAEILVDSKNTINQIDAVEPNWPEIPNKEIK